MHRFDVIIPNLFSNLPEDSVVNTWHFEHAGGPATDYDNVRDMLADFYGTTPEGQTESISDNMPSNILGDIWNIRAYDLSQPKPRAPVYESTLTVDNGLGSAATLPLDVALCFSFEAEQESGIPQARRRNRKYIGPLDTGTLSSGGRPSLALLGIVAAAGRDLLRASNAAASWTWKVWSTTLQAGYDVRGGWVDDEFDTQRRRGMAPSYRELWDVDVPDPTP